MSALTDTEHRALDLTAELARLLMGEVISHGPARAQDLSEAVTLVHSLQHMIMAQAAAREHPDRYRLLGDA